MKIETLEDAFIHELSDIYNAEKQLTKALPKMAEAAVDSKLITAFETHLEETKEQIEILDQVVEACGIRLKRETCDAMKGLIEEGSEIIQEVEEGPVRDAMLIAAAQKVEHYEIASYGSLVALADKLDYVDAADLLEEILEQEKETDDKLNMIAEQRVNDNALRQSSSEGDWSSM